MNRIDEVFLRMALALAVGLIVGVERGWQLRHEREGGRTAGVRTFGLIGLFGGVAAMLSVRFGSTAPWLVCLALLTAGFGAFSWREGKATNDFSVTNLVAAMTVFILGVVAGAGEMRVAAAGGVVTAILLASRQTLHRAVERLTWLELRSALLLLAMSVVVMPLLPDRTVDPLGAVNPRELWLLMCLVAAVSYAGYVALKVSGPDKGPPVAGLAGGLASSTATTIAMARLSRGHDNADGLSAGASLAAMVSLLRVVLLCAVAQPQLASSVATPALAAAAVFAVAGAAPLLRPQRQAARKADIGVPFELIAVLGFGLLLATISLVGAWIRQRSGAVGGLAFAAISGLLDVDAITLSSARAVGHGLTLEAARQGVLLATAANTVQKVVFAWMLGSKPFAWRFGAASAAAVVVGAAAFALT